MHTLWSEAVGELTSLLAVPAEKINMGDIDKAEAVLLLLREMMNAGPSSREEHKKLSDDFYSLIPHNAGKLKNIDTKRVLVEKQDLCQVSFLYEQSFSNVLDFRTAVFGNEGQRVCIGFGLYFKLDF